MREIDLIDEPITTKDYQIYDIQNLPKVFLGIKVKNKLDETRFDIKSVYKPKLVAHFKQHTQLEPAFFYGIEIKPKKRFIKLFQLFNNRLSLSRSSYDEFLNTYRMILAEFDLSCRNCYGYLSDGIYPVDIEHLTKISRKDYSKEIESGFEKMIVKNNKPWYMNLYNFNLLVFGEPTGYNSDFTVNSVHTY